MVQQRTDKYWGEANRKPLIRPLGGWVRAECLERHQEAASDNNAPTSRLWPGQRLPGSSNRAFRGERYFGRLSDAGGVQRQPPRRLDHRFRGEARAGESLSAIDGKLGEAR